VNTLTLTNWETVLVFKTNWVKQPVAKVVEVNLPAAPADVVKAPAADRKSRPPQPPPTWSQEPAGQWKRFEPKNGQPTTKWRCN